MNKFIAFFAAFAFLMSGTSFAFAETNAKSNLPANNLISLLPASDAVISMDMKRLMSEALPQLLSSNPQALAQVMAHFDEFKTKTGIDARQFEQIAVGIKYNRVSPNRLDIAPIAITRGAKINAPGLISVAKIALGNKFREEKVGKRNVLVVSLRDVAAQLPQSNEAAKNGSFSKLISRLMTGEIGFVAVDQNTLAFGDIKQVRALTESGAANRANADLAGLATRNPNAILSFAGNFPADAMSLFRMDNDEIGNIVGSLRMLFGSMEVAGGNANFSLTARTETAAQAKNLNDTLVGLQSLTGFLRMKRGARNQVLADLADSVKFLQTANDVEMRFVLPQNDLNKLLGSF